MRENPAWIPECPNFSVRLVIFPVMLKPDKRMVLPFAAALFAAALALAAIFAFAGALFSAEQPAATSHGNTKGPTDLGKSLTAGQLEKKSQGLQQPDPQSYSHLS